MKWNNFSPRGCEAVVKIARVRGGFLIEFTGPGGEYYGLTFLSDASHDASRDLENLSWQEAAKGYWHARVPGGWFALTLAGLTVIPDPDHLHPPDPF